MIVDHLKLYYIRALCLHDALHTYTYIGINVIILQQSAHFALKFILVLFLSIKECSRTIELVNITPQKSNQTSSKKTAVQLADSC